LAGALAGSLAGAGFAWAITIGTKMTLSTKAVTVKMANLLILILLSFEEILMKKIFSHLLFHVLKYNEKKKMSSKI